MKLKNTALPLLLCMAIVLILAYAPEKVSGIFDRAAMGKTETSQIQEDTEEKNSLEDCIELIYNCEKNSNIFHVTDEYYEQNLDTSEENYPSPQLTQRIQRELDLLEELSLLPGIDLEEMELWGFHLERYMDVRNESSYVSMFYMEYQNEAETLGLLYSAENEKILMYNYMETGGRAFLAEDETEILNKWSNYLDVQLAYSQQYYTYTAYQDPERGLHEWTIQIRS